MFRPISMVVPDSNLIAEIILFGEGFNNTKVGRAENGWDSLGLVKSSGDYIHVIAFTLLNS